MMLEYPGVQVECIIVGVHCNMAVLVVSLGPSML